MYIAPELIEIKNLKNVNSPAIDMWGLGITFYYMITFKFPWEIPDYFYSLNFEQKNNFMLKLLQKPVSAIDGFHPTINDLIQKCLKVNPLERITSKDMHQKLISLIRDLNLPTEEHVTFENFSNCKNTSESSSC